MKKCFLYLLFCFCLNPILFAQNDWENAIVILQNGDSLVGKTMYKNEKDIYLGFTFKDLTNSIKRFKVQEIRSLILPDYTIQYDCVTFKVNKDTVSILAALITNGTVHLYQSETDPKKLGLGDAISPFFLIKSPKGTIPLLHNNDPTQAEYNKFKRMLNYVIGDCINEHQIYRLKYLFNDILEVVQDYNKCKDPNTIISTVNIKQSIPPIVSHRIMFGGVVASSSVGTYVDNYGRIFDKPYTGGMGFTLGYSIQAIYPSISKRICTEFGLGLVYIRQKADPSNRYFLKQDDNDISGRIKIIEGFLLSQNTAIIPIIQVGPSLKFTTSLLSIKPLLNIGGGFNFNKCQISGLIEFPFNSLNYDSFYSLNFKYTFAHSENKKQK